MSDQIAGAIKECRELGMYITVEQLAAILPRIPAGSKISVNKVFNLLIESPEGEYLGFIDIGIYRPDRDILTLFAEQQPDEEEDL